MCDLNHLKISIMRIFFFGVEQKNYKIGRGLITIHEVWKLHCVMESILITYESFLLYGIHLIYQ